MVPESDGRYPVMQLKRVVLPEPLGPMRLTSSPRSMAKLTESTAVTPRKRLVRPRTSRSAINSGPRPPAEERVQPFRGPDDDGEQQGAVDHQAPRGRHAQHLGQRGEEDGADDDAAQAAHAAQEQD